MTRVELFEAIRRDHEREGLQVRALARRYGVHRRTVRQALASPVPPPRKKPEREAPVLGGALRWIDEWLLADREVRPKQRHTSRRMWQRLRDELGIMAAESSVRLLVARRRRALSLGAAEAFVPQVHAPGAEAEVDWYEADVDFPWGRERAQFFEMRACASGREFHMAFPNQTQQAFFEGHVAAFTHYGGIFGTVRYDNLKTAVARILRGRDREETDRFVILRSYYGFDSVFCRPGKEGAHEKGGVESGVGRFRRAHLVPIPKVKDYDELNAWLREAMHKDDQRTIEGRRERIFEVWAKEVPALKPLPREPFDAALRSWPVVDDKARVAVRASRYSVPVELVGRRIEAVARATTVEVLYEGKVVARHPRCLQPHGERLELDHYLGLLQKKPGALRNALPLAQARAEGRWPAIYDKLWKELRVRNGESRGTRQLVEVLLLARDHDSVLVHRAVEMALERGCHDADAVRSILLNLISPAGQRPPRLSDLGTLQRYDRPEPGVTDYDALLACAEEAA